MCVVIGAFIKTFTQRYAARIITLVAVAQKISTILSVLLNASRASSHKNRAAIARVLASAPRVP